MATSIKVACGQLCSSSNLQANARVVKKLILKAVAEKAKVLFLPEATDYISKDAAESLELAQYSHERFISAIQDELRQLHSKGEGDLYVAVGVHEPSHTKSMTDSKLNKVENNQLWIDTKGEILHRYQKLHLFDISITNGPILKESNSVEAGSKVLPPFSINDTDPDLSPFRVGFATCYDIRFPELTLRLRSLGANIITFPSAFTTKTGMDHWLALGKARALDSQCFVAMAAQCGEHATDGSKKRVSYGNSVVFDPWGNILAQAPDYTNRAAPDADGDYYELIVADLDLAWLEKVRSDMPLMTHRRPDVFGYEV